MTLQHLTYLLQGGKANRTHLARFQIGQIGDRDADGIGKFLKLHFAIGENTIKTSDDRHRSHRHVMVFLQVRPIIEDIGENQDDQTHEDRLEANHEVRIGFKQIKQIDQMQ